MLKLAVKSWVAKMAATILNFGTVVVLSRNLGAAERGTCAFYTVIIALSLVFNELAAGSTAIFLQQQINWRQIRRIAAAWSLIASGLVCILFWILGKYGWFEMMLLWIVSVLNGIVTIQYNILLGHRKYLIYNLLSVLTPFSILLQMVALVLYKLSSPVHYLIVINIAVALSLIVGWLALNRIREPAAIRMPWREVGKRAFGSGLINQAGHVISILNNRFIYYILPAASLGVFTNALSLAEAMLLVPGSMGQIYYSQAAETASRRDGDKKGNGTFRKLMFYNLLLLALGLLGIALIPGQFYTWLFGPQFSGVKSYLLVLAVGTFFYSIYLLNSYWQSSRGHFKNNLLAGVFGLIFNLLGILFLIRFEKIRPENVAVLMSGSFLVVALASIWLFRKAQAIEVAPHVNRNPDR